MPGFERVDENGLPEDVGIKSYDFRFSPDIMEGLIHVFKKEKKKSAIRLTLTIGRYQTISNDDNRPLQFTDYPLCLGHYGVPFANQFLFILQNKPRG